ncbi:MAG: carbamoyltransferase HypF [Candidatus Cloacimonetes bacterium]|nr:carbamoyltransferase HypF [Candidatus Cloacimonadota bacterium]
MLRIEINGIVQGVGFRPFVYNLAKQFDLKGFVLNSSQGVTIEVEGLDTVLQSFIDDLQGKKPPAARIDRFIVKEFPEQGFKTFEIRKSLSNEGLTFISPDLAVCNDCIDELKDPQDQRFNYAFINCTNCGPRYSIIEKTPYDRPVTSMKVFEMCDYCRGQYEDPTNRRFHAQPIACPVCGPQLRFLDSTLREVSGDPIENCLKALHEGKILGIKGIGGFHIACDATNNAAVNELRRRKNRPHKPFAVMCEVVRVREIADCPESQLELMKSPAAPILLLPKLSESPIAQSVAPLNPYLGIFLPYAPHHYQLFHNKSFLPDPIKLPFLVMTSGNINDEPIAITEEGLTGLCDFYLTHNRPILNRNDDSIISPLISTSQIKFTSIFIRRSRGYIPTPLLLPFKTVPTFGAGAELKIAFALTDQDSLYHSPYIGNNNSIATQEFYQETYIKYLDWFKIKPELVACDLHPDYMTTRFAEKISLPLVKVQHHHAHIAAVMGEFLLDEPVIGISYDGTGYGTDGAIWGGEIFIADYKDFTRRYHLNYMPLPGGDATITHPVRIAYAYLKHAGVEVPELQEISEFEKSIIDKQIENQFNLFQTSSMGRLFDCIAAMLGLFPQITFEAQSAMALEYLCGKASLDEVNPYDYQINESEIDIIPLIKNVREDVLQGADKRIIALRFHKTIVDFSLAVVNNLSHSAGLRKVILSGGVMQNMVLLKGLINELTRNNFTVYYSSQLPSNDGAVSVGQALIANRTIIKG